MSVPQQTGAMQAATVRCPPNVFRERYSLADFEVTQLYGVGPNWSVYAARCKWSDAPVVLQTYTEVGNLSGCMAAALSAAHGLNNHPSFLPLYAVFRDVAVASGTPAEGSGRAASPSGGHSGGGGGGGAARGDRVIMVYPGGTAQHPLDAGGSPASTSSSSSSPSPPRSSGGGSGPPVSERGVVRGLLQPLNDLVTVLSPMGLRPPYVCGLDVWMDSPEAPGPGQALFMVPLLCHRRSHHPPTELLPAALPYTAPYLRTNPAAAGDQDGTDEGQARRWLSWSAAALVHTVLMGSPPPEKAAHRRARASLPPISSAASVPQLPPLLTSGSSPMPRGGGSMLLALGMQRPGGAMLMQGGQPGSNGDAGNGHSRGSPLGGSSGSSGGVHGMVAKRNSGSSSSRVANPMPLWLSDEAGDWFRRGLALDCLCRVPLEELMRHGWVSRHAVPRSLSNGHVMKRDSLGFMPRELHPLLLDVVPMGLSRPGREEVDSMMAEMAAGEAPSAAKPAMPWQVVEGPQGPVQPVEVEEFTEDAAVAFADIDDRDTSVIERYEVAEEEREDGTRIVEELRVLSEKPDGALNRAAKALQAAMARRGDGGQWVMANPRGTTFDDIARQNGNQRPQLVAAPALPVPQRRVSSGAPAPPALAVRARSPDLAPPATTSTRISTTSLATTTPPSPAVGRNKSPGPKGARAPTNPKAARAPTGGPKAGKTAK